MEFDTSSQPVKSNEEPIRFLPSNIQIENVFAIEIVAKRFPIDFSQMQLSPNVGLGMGEIQVNTENSHAQVVLNMQVDFANEPRPFEISFKLLGIFTYGLEYNLETLNLFLTQGSLSIMLPFARELLTSICTRLQVPPMLLPLIQLTPHPTMNNAEEAHNE